MTHKCRQAASPHADVTVDDSSEHENAATDYAVVRDEQHAKFIEDLIECGLEVKNTTKGLPRFGDAIIQTEAQHRQRGVAKNSEAIH